MTYPIVEQEMLTAAGVVVSNQVASIVWWLAIPAFIYFAYIPHKPAICVRTFITSRYQSKKQKVFTWMLYISILILLIGWNSSEYQPMPEAAMPSTNATYVEFEHGWKSSPDSIQVKLDGEMYRFGLGTSIRVASVVAEKLKVLPVDTVVQIKLLLISSGYKVSARVAKLAVDDDVIFSVDSYEERLKAYEHDLFTFRLMLAWVLFLSVLYVWKGKPVTKKTG